MKLTIDTNEKKFPAEEIPFNYVVSTELEDIVKIKKFPPSYLSSGIMSMSASSLQTMCRFFIDPNEIHLFTQNMTWEKKDMTAYRRFLSESEISHVECNNISEIRERVYERGRKTRGAIGQHLLASTDENNIRTEYCHTWIEMKEQEICV